VNDFLRTYATPISFVTFLGCALTGLLLFFGVRGGELGDVHEWLGVVFVVVLILHLARNWRGVMAMLTSPRAKLVTGIIAVVVAGFVIFAIPFGGGGHGQGHGQGFHAGGLVMGRIAQVPIAQMAPALGLSSDEAVARLKRAGVPVEGPQDSLAHLARDHGQRLPQMLNLLLNGEEG
jgi:hypothetical protein